MTDAPATVCVICGAPEPFGLSVCPACGGTAQAVGDTLIFVKPTEARHDMRHVLGALEPLLAGRAHREGRDLVAAGHRALIRVPAAAAERVVRRLALHDVPAVARTARTTWASAPASLYVLLGIMVLVGTWAGRVAEPMLLWISPMMALLLLLAAQVRMRAPAIASPHRRAAFPATVETLIVTTFAQLPLGTARDLLASLVQAAEPTYRALRRGPAGGACKRDVEQLLTHACRAAIDLSDLDHGLAAVLDEAAIDRVTSLHDGLASRFRKGVSVLYRLRAEAVDADPAHEELTELLEALDADATAYAAARAEVDAWLEPKTTAD
ncbi:MAG: hypothetical protein OER90_10315 [Gemmatimonadota bacterium]|nr:hypothetical protein [Gemmatimonadota bacterium]